MPKPVMLVEDEPEISELLTFSLRRAGFETVTCDTAEQALRSIDTQRPLIAIIDWMLPGMSGVDLAYRLRQDPHTKELPIIMLTARGEEADKLQSFDSGVDDYVTKPFSPKELVARIRALLRRSGVDAHSVIETSGIRIDTGSRRVFLNGQEEHFGPKEFSLLEFLVSHPNRVFDRGNLLDHVWGRGVYVEDRTVDVHILRLRKVLKKHGLERLVQTVRGFGYRFSDEESAPSNTA